MHPDHPKKYLSDHIWSEQFGAIEKIQTESYGKVTSLRINYKNGPEVEYGFTTPDWADIPDAGTRQVITEGAKILYDPRNKLHVLLEHINQGLNNENA